MADDQEQLRQHWQQLAEQLGLDAPEQPAPAPAVSKKEEELAAPKVDQAEKTVPSEIRTEHEETFVRNEDKAFGAGVGANEAKAAPAKAPASDQFVAVAETSGDAVFAEPPVDEPRPGRRERRERRPERGERDRSSHRRRDSGPRRREETSTSAAEPAEDLPETNEDFTESELEEIEPSFVDETSSSEVRKEDDEADPDDVDTLSDWNVPSWAELIASLYRPER